MVTKIRVTVIDYAVIHEIPGIGHLVVAHKKRIVMDHNLLFLHSWSKPMLHEFPNPSIHYGS